MVPLTRVSLIEGDITKLQVDAIVNAANTSLLGGGGVDGAIHRAGGPAILAECRTLGGCPTGQARITNAGNLPAKHVIHAVGPVWHGGDHGEAALLASAYRSSLAIAEDYRLRSVAFPSISTGAYRYPMEEAAQIAIKAVTEFLESAVSVHDVTFVLFGDRAMAAYDRVLDDIRARRDQR